MFAATYTRGSANFNGVALYYGIMRETGLYGAGVLSTTLNQPVGARPLRGHARLYLTKLFHRRSGSASRPRRRRQSRRRSLQKRPRPASPGCPWPGRSFWQGQQPIGAWACRPSSIVTTMARPVRSPPFCTAPRRPPRAAAIASSTATRSTSRWVTQRIRRPGQNFAAMPSSRSASDRRVASCGASATNTMLDCGGVTVAVA